MAHISIGMVDYQNLLKMSIVTKYFENVIILGNTVVANIRPCNHHLVL